MEIQRDAQKVVDRVRAAYAACKTYKDRGQTTSILPQAEGDPLVSYQTFSTVLVRPDQFRFEFRDRFPERQFGRHVVWRDGSSVKSWRYQFNPKVEVERELGLALAGATGVSHGVAALIPQLLLPEEVDARGLFGDVAVELVGLEQCAGHDCVKLKKSGNTNGFVWIEIGSALIVRVEERTAVSYQMSGSGSFYGMIVGSGGLTSSTIIQYRSLLNSEIFTDELDFGEPFADYGDDVEVINPTSRRI